MYDRIQELRKARIALQDAHDGVQAALLVAYEVAQRGDSQAFAKAWADLWYRLGIMAAKANEKFEI
jgi:hypothetical protein